MLVGWAPASLLRAAVSGRFLLVIQNSSATTPIRAANRSLLSQRHDSPTLRALPLPLCYFDPSSISLLIAKLIESAFTHLSLSLSSTTLQHALYGHISVTRYAKAIESKA